MAYDLTNPQCSCQSSALPVLSERYDIQAKAEHPVGSGEMLRLLQSLLADRFRLVVRRETKELPAFALVVDKGGPKLHVSNVVHIDVAGHYDLELKFAGQSPTAPPPDSDAPSIFTALREQLGLRLDAERIPLEVLSVEHAEMPTDN